MRIDILTLFPEMFSALSTSIIGKAVEKGYIKINITDIRPFSLDKHKKCDDYLSNCYSFHIILLLQNRELVTTLYFTIIPRFR